MDVGRELGEIERLEEQGVDDRPVELEQRGRLRSGDHDDRQAGELGTTFEKSNDFETATDREDQVDDQNGIDFFLQQADGIGSVIGDIDLKSFVTDEVSERARKCAVVFYQQDEGLRLGR